MHQPILLIGMLASCMKMLYELQRGYTYTWYIEGLSIPAEV